MKATGRMVSVAVVALLMACGGGSDTSTDSSQSVTPSRTEEASRTPLGTNEFGVRYCEFIPGESEPAEMPAEVLNPPLSTSIPTATLPAQTTVSADVTEAQLATFDGLRNAVRDVYVYPDYNGRDWETIADSYESTIMAGLSETDFATVMNLLVRELGDHHSYYQSAEVAAAEDARVAEGQNFVGIGILANPLSSDVRKGAIISVFPGSPAADAGLRTHDLLLEVDGQPYRDENGIARSLGPEGTSFELTYQRPGEQEHTITMTRRAVRGSFPVDYCIVTGTRIGYMLIPTFLDSSIDDQTRAALEKLTADGPLDGLVIDNRQNGGGSGEVTETTLGFLTGGPQGRFISRNEELVLDVESQDIGGSQTVPLVVLVGPDTVSNGEVFSGILQLSGRAQILGQTTAGNVERLHDFTFNDGSRAWLAAETFAPQGLEPGAWEGVAIEPDVELPTRWDLFTEANDPALARAIDLLQ